MARKAAAISYFLAMVAAHVGGIVTDMSGGFRHRDGSAVYCGGQSTVRGEVRCQSRIAMRDRRKVRQSVFLKSAQANNEGSTSRGSNSGQIY
jgi:hypothetical protein